MALPQPAPACYAEVALDAPIAEHVTLTYAVPPGMAVTVGQAVWVPLGPRLTQGIIFDLTATPKVAAPRCLEGPVAGQPSLASWQLDLAHWISRYYRCSLFAAAALFMPPGFEQEVLTVVRSVPAAFGQAVGALTPRQRHILRYLDRHGSAELGQLTSKLGDRHLTDVIDQLAQQGLVHKEVLIPRPKAGPKFMQVLCLAEELPEETDLHRSPRQTALVAALQQAGGRLSRTDLRKQGFSGPVIAGLLTKQLVRWEYVRALRDPLSHITPQETPAPTLTAGQEQVWSVLREALDRSACRRLPAGEGTPSSVGAQFIASPGDATRGVMHHAPTLGIPNTSSEIFVAGTTPFPTDPQVFLLHGVTGSGKTEVYLRALAHVVAQGRRGIVLVPEIALTPQMVDRFAARFPGRVAVLHSGLSAGEQFDAWWRIHAGACDVVIGSRSALFAPQPDLGLIVLDEEHDSAYKQGEPAPRYHARRVAEAMARMTGALLLLGSATPDLETYTHAQEGRYRLLEMPERVPAPSLDGGTGGGSHDPALGRLPDVEIVDLRQELREGNRSIFSRALMGQLAQTLQAGRQAILFLNRRGAATFVQCRDCGHALTCRRCDVALTYHSAGERLLCHQCNARTPVPRACPACGSVRIKFLGLGTQRVEEEVRKLFPAARVLRWDRDTARTRKAHEAVLRQFEDRAADILVGTQMIAKGLDLPQVTLVGVVNADVNLYLPDFRAAERTFQLLTQVAGRAGRGSWAGQVIIQTYTPDHYAIQCAARQDYRSFYEQEAAYRQRHGYPPFGRMARLRFAHPNAERAQQEAEALAHRLREAAAMAGLASVVVLGPVPGYPKRVRGHYRWQITLLGGDPGPLLERVVLPRGWVLDVDPVGLG